MKQSWRKQIAVSQQKHKLAVLNMLKELNNFKKLTNTQISLIEE